MLSYGKNERLTMEKEEFLQSEEDFHYCEKTYRQMNGSR